MLLLVYSGVLLKDGSLDIFWHTCRTISNFPSTHIGPMPRIVDSIKCRPYPQASRSGFLACALKNGCMCFGEPHWYFDPLSSNSLRHFITIYPHQRGFVTDGLIGGVQETCQCNVAHARNDVKGTSKLALRSVNQKRGQVAPRR